MGSFVLFVSPGLGPADVAAARARYEAEEEKDDWLDQKRVREVADALMREHGLTVECEDDERPGEVRGIDLERDPEDDTDPDVRVDGWGVMVSVFAPDSGAVPASNVDRAVAIARSAARLLGSGIYDVMGDRMLPASEGDESLRSAAAAAFARPASSLAVGPPKGAIVALALLVFAPGLLLLVLRRRVGGGTLFLLMFGTMIVGAILAARYGTRRPTGSPSAAPPPGPPTSGVDGRPIGPS